ncbi:MAG: AAA family ATPase [Candidatus Atribacteria bacterium]|nr:AAA family ATPase [Candidatus Atribacteria bacterium]
MIIKKIYLENWKIFRNPFERDFSEGLNIIYGPNESGKTTLIDSIRTTLFSKHTSQSEKIKSLVPWGSSLSPGATITFSHYDELYRISKRFISSQSLLEKFVDGSWERIAEGDRADNEIIKLIGGKFPSRGDTKPELWGLGQTLWMVQGQPIIEKEQNLNEETLSSIQKLIGAVVETDIEKKLFNKILTQFLNIYTEKRRDFRKDSQIFIIKEQIKALEKEKEEIDLKKVEKENLIQDIEDKEILLQKKKPMLEAALQEKDELKSKINLAHEHRLNREKLNEEVKRISSDYKNLAEQIGEIQKNENNIKEIELHNEKLSKEKKLSEEDLERLLKEIDTFNQNLDNRIGIYEQKETEHRYALTAHTAIQEEIELKEKEERLKKVNDLEQEKLEKKKKLESLIAPSQKDLNIIEDYYQKIHDAQTKFDALGLKIKVSAQTNIFGKIHLDDKSVEFDIKKGEKKDWISHEVARISFDKVGEIEIMSGSEDVKEMKKELEEFKIEFEKRTAPYETKAIDELRDRFHQKNELENHIKRLENEIKGHTKNVKEIVIGEIAELKKRIESNWSKIPENFDLKKYAENENKTQAKEICVKKINELEKELEEHKDKERNLKKDLDELNKKKDTVQNKIRNLEKTLHGNNERKSVIQKSLENLQKDGLTLKEREEKLNEISIELDRKERALQKYTEEIEEMENQPEKAFVECENKMKRLDQDIHQLEKDLAEKNGKLKSMLVSFKDTNRIEEELFFLKEEERRLEVEASAIGLLYDLIQVYKTKSIESLSDPVKKLVNEDLKRLLGIKYTVHLDEGIKPISVVSSSWGAEVPIEDLSFGTEEQIWYLFRLALGRLLSYEEKQLVVLDDPLANTDASRLHRALQILEDAAKQLQIIVVTCDVDKYNWLSNANYITMDK